MGGVTARKFLRNNPHAILKNFESSKAALGKGRRPAWINAVSMFPPSPASFRQVIPSEVGHFSLLPDITNMQATQHDAAYNRPSRVRPSKIKPHVAAYATVPPQIVYPEDSLRERFYKEHPFEMKRPKSLVETEEGLAKSVEGRGEVLVEESVVERGVFLDVSGEDVVRRTQHLATKQGGWHSPEEAYRLSLASFYRHRIAEEKAATTTTSTASQTQPDSATTSESESTTTAAGASSKKATTANSNKDSDIEELLVHKELAWFRTQEKAHIAENNALLEAQQSEMKQRQQVQSQMSQFEARNQKAASMNDNKKS